MHRRSYGQFCGLAAALDALGERWTLLIVRDLLLGPRRYGDLLAGLPGISTDLLAERLRTLEELGAVRRRKLPPPASVTVYELTDRGRDLRDAVAALARWGENLLPSPGTPGYRIDAAWAIGSMAYSYAGGAPDGVYRLVLDDRDYVVEVRDGLAEAVDGPPTTEPIATISGPAPAFLAVVAGRSTLAKAAGDGLVVTGDRAAARRFVAGLSVPSGAAASGRPA